MPKTVLASIDLEDRPAAEAVMAQAQAQAGEDGSVTACAVVPNYGFGVVRSHFPDNFEATITQAVEQNLKDFCDRHGGDAVGRWIGHGSVYSEIIRAATEMKADLVVVGSGDNDLSDQILGSQASRIVAHAPCSVLVVRG
jgi:nucleotide-binding universal stress UspA family protein